MKHHTAYGRYWMVLFDLTLLALTALVIVLIERDINGLPRVFATLAFACLVPGGALVTRLPFREPNEVLAVTVVLSLAILAAATLLRCRATLGCSGSSALPSLAGLPGFLRLRHATCSLESAGPTSPRSASSTTRTTGSSPNMSAR
jgi:hypothetical protein